MSTTLKLSAEETYAKRAAQQAEWHRDKIRRGRTVRIGEVVKPKRRAAALLDFKKFCNTYFKAEFSKKWAPYHHETAEAIQHAVETGGWYARALPRGGGKTTIASKGVLWAALRGTHPYVVLIGASEKLAVNLLKGIKMQLMTNDLLCEDFPHVIEPFRELDGQAARAKGQLAPNGARTHIEWSTDRIVFPWISHEDSISNGTVIESFGITGAVRGLIHTLPNGQTIRPSIALVDDPQTRESAKSVSQSQSRLDTLTGDIAYLAGPGEDFTVVVPCTVIYEGDLSDRILDRKKHPEWHGQRTRMVESFPANMELWDEYAELLREELRGGGTGKKATAFYRKHRKAMDKGSKVSWEQRKKKGEVSAIQHAMNLKIRDERAFMAEMQNDPVVEQDEISVLKEDQIAEKIMNYDRGVIPEACTHLTAFADVQDKHFFWMVCAWEPDFTGYIIDYGAWPEQTRSYFTRADLRRNLYTVYGGSNVDESSLTFSGLTDLEARIRGPSQMKSGEPCWVSKDGREMEIDRWCIDGNWRVRERAVTSYAKQSTFAHAITITYGRGVTATQKPFSQASQAIKFKTGPGWFWETKRGPAMSVAFDANLWKMRVQNALSLQTGARGGITLFKGTPQRHRMIAEHLASEKPVKVFAKGRTVFQWELRGARDNDGLDCLVGCTLAASIAGLTREAETISVPKQRMSLKELEAQAGSLR